MKFLFRQNRMPLLSALLCAVFLIGGCANEDRGALKDGSDSTLELVFGDNKKMDALSKASVLSGTGQFLWEAGDSISIYFGNYPSGAYKPFEVDNLTVDISGESSPRDKYAIFPATSTPAAGEAFASDGRPRVVYPAKIYIKNAGKTETESRMPILAVNSADAQVVGAENVNKLIFYHVGALLRVRMQGLLSNAKSAKLTFEKSTVTGTFTVDVTDPTQPQANANAIVGTGGKEIIFNFPDVGLVGNAYLNVPLPLGTYESEKLTLRLYNQQNAQGTELKVFERDINLASVNRADGRLLGFSMDGTDSAIAGVSIENTPPNNELYLEDIPFDYNLTAVIFYNNGAPNRADPSLVTWMSDNPNVVLVDDNGKIAAVSEGEANITATSKEDNSKYDTVKITVKRNAPESDFKQLPFSTGENTTVVFSPGNLQAEIKDLANPGGANGAEWRFANKQYEYIGALETPSLAVNAVIDLFYDQAVEEGSHKYGIRKLLQHKPFPTIDYFDFIDWGNNAIGYRGNDNYAMPYEYRTLTMYEWDYILNKRTGDKAGTIYGKPDCRYSMVTVEDVFGMILYPDEFVWVRSTMGTPPTRFNTYSPASGSYSGANWAALEKAGVVFLPAAGFRIPDAYEVADDTYDISSPGTEGKYATSSAYSPYNVTNYYWYDGGWSNGLSFNRLRYREAERYYLRFNQGHSLLNIYDQNGASVRLVKGGKSVRRIVMDKGIQLYLNKPGKNTNANVATIHYQDGTTNNTDASLEFLPYNWRGHTCIWDDNSMFSINGNTITANSYGYAVLIAKDPVTGFLSEISFVGATDGTVHLSNGKKVTFAPGNLQARLNNGNIVEWRFAPNPWETINDDPNYSGGNANITRTGTGWIDLFFKPTSTNRKGVDNNGSTGNFVDWSGSDITCNTQGYWRSPTSEEMFDIFSRMTFRDGPGHNYYLYYTEYNNSYNYGYVDNDNRKLVVKNSSPTGTIAQHTTYSNLNGNLCIIIPPDGYILPIMDNVNGVPTSQQWADLIAEGVVILTAESGWFEANNVRYVRGYDVSNDQQDPSYEDWNMIYDQWSRFIVNGPCVRVHFHETVAQGTNYKDEQNYVLIDQLSDALSNVTAGPVRLIHVE